MASLGVGQKEKRKEKELKTLNKIVGSLKYVDMSDLEIPMIAVYEHPADFPRSYVARIWEGRSGKPTNTMIIRTSLEEIRLDIVAAGFPRICPRTEKDDACIVETWVR